MSGSNVLNLKVTRFVLFKSTFLSCLQDRLVWELADRIGYFQMADALYTYIQGGADFDSTLTDFCHTPHFENHLRKGPP